MRNLIDQDRWNFLNSNPVLVARHFQFKVECLLRKYYWMDLWRKKYYVLRIEFHKRGSPHVHLFFSIFNNNGEEYISFTEKTINAKLSDSKSQPDLFNLLKTYQIESSSNWKPFGNVIKNIAFHLAFIILIKLLL